MSLELSNYRPLNAAFPHPEASLVRCAAEGGSKQLRLCLKALDEPSFRVAAYQSRRFCALCSFGFGQGVAFTVQLNGAEEKIWLNRESLKKRFQVSDRLVGEALSSDDLMRIVCLKMLRKNWAEAPAFARQRDEDLRFSRKGYNLQESVYVCRDTGLVAFGLRGKLVKKFNHAALKKARTIDGRVIVRRTCDDSKEVRKLIEFFRRFNGKPGIIDLLGVCSYKKLSGKRKIVTFHSLFDRSLHDVITDGKILSETTQLNYADQLFTALLALDGAHGDLKPENIVVGDKDKKTALIDLECYRDKTESGNHYKGTAKWASPECLGLGKTAVNKLDVWPAGLILYYLFLGAEARVFPWQENRCSKKHTKEEAVERVLSLLKQKTVDTYLQEAKLSAEKKTLLRKMLVVDVEKRCTMEEAVDYFRKHIFRADQLPSEQKKG